MLQRDYREVLTHHCKVGVEVFDVGKSQLRVLSLENEALCPLVHVHRLGMINLKLCALNVRVSNESHHMLDGDFPRHVGMGVHCVVTSWLCADVAIKSVTSIEELTDVSSIGLSYEKSSTWVLMYVIGKVKHKVVKNAQVFSLANSYIEFSLGDYRIAISGECVFSVFHELEISFKSQEKHNRQHQIEWPKEL